MNCNLLRSHGRIFCFCLWVVILCPSFVSLVRSRSGCLGLRTYFLTSSECSGCFRCKLIGSYVLTSGIGVASWMVWWLPNLSQVVGMETCISCSGCVSISGSNCVSGITLIPLSAFPCAWPSDHGRGRFRATYLARMCHYGCRIRFPGR